MPLSFLLELLASHSGPIIKVVEFENGIVRDMVGGRTPLVQAVTYARGAHDVGTVLRLKAVQALGTPCPAVSDSYVDQEDYVSQANAVECTLFSDVATSRGTKPKSGGKNSFDNGQSLGKL